MVNIRDSHEETENAKKEIIKYLNNFEKPQMISNVTTNEVDKFSLLLAIAKEIEVRNGLDNSLFNTFLLNNLIIRRSIKNIGSEQLVKVINKILEEEQQQNLNNKMGLLR